MLRVRAMVTRFFAVKNQKGAVKSQQTISGISFLNTKAGTSSQKTTKEKYKTVILLKKVQDFFRDYPPTIRHKILQAQTIEQQITQINEWLSVDMLPSFFLEKFFAIFTKPERQKILKLLHTGHNIANTEKCFNI